MYQSGVAILGMLRRGHLTSDHRRSLIEAKVELPLFGPDIMDPLEHEAMSIYGRFRMHEDRRAVVRANATLVSAGLQGGCSLPGCRARRVPKSVNLH